MITDCVIRGIPNTIGMQYVARQLRADITGLKLRLRGRGARNRFEHQELPMIKAPRFSAYYQGLNASGGHGDCKHRIYFDFIMYDIDTCKPHLKLGAKA